MGVVTVKNLTNTTELTPIKIQGYGWRNQQGDHRDKILQLSIPESIIPDSVDQRPQMPPVYNQFSLGSCTANAIAAAVQFDAMKQGLSNGNVIPSRLFIYFLERLLEGTSGIDAGANLRDGFKTINTQGVCGEDLWPYDISKFAVPPSLEAYQAAALHKSIVYQAVNQEQTSIQSALAFGYPIAFGFSVPQSFESPVMAQTGVMALPQPGESILGGHAVLLCGYIVLNGILYGIVRNSWGPGWGQLGYFLMPMSLILDQNWASDFWTVTVMS